MLFGSGGGGGGSFVKSWLRAMQKAWKNFGST